ncbi:MAG: hypothetical protein NTX88_02630 [Candidatus Atribacteria bacterium]|nr:hypothetical protein [Candidatus Atribacteria bacterium]
MEKEKDSVREMFEELFFGPMNCFFGSVVSHEVREHLSQARVETLKAIRSFIDGESPRFFTSPTPGYFSLQQ